MEAGFITLWEFAGNAKTWENSGKEIEKNKTWEKSKFVSC